MEMVKILDKDILVQAEKVIKKDYEMVADKVNDAAKDVKKFTNETIKSVEDYARVNPAKALAIAAAAGALAAFGLMITFSLTRKK